MSLAESISGAGSYIREGVVGAVREPPTLGTEGPVECGPW